MKFMSVKRTVGEMIVDEMNRTRQEAVTTGASKTAHPPYIYSPNLSTCDFFLFPRLKKELQKGVLMR